VTPDQGPTTASNSVQIGGVQVRQAAAAKNALFKEATTRLEARQEDLHAAPTG
jgi:nicotinate dehydrogenase subunit B